MNIKKRCRLKKSVMSVKLVKNEKNIKLHPQIKIRNQNLWGF